MKFLLTICALTLSFCCFGKTIHAGKTEVVNTLGKAIELAADGDTILLHKGLYREHNLVLTKSVVLIGIDNPVLDGEGKHQILTVSGRNIIIRGISFINAGYSAMNDNASIGVIDATGIIIENNTIRNSFFGIHIANANNSLVRNNIIEGSPKNEQTSGNGIHLWKCNDMLIEGNAVSGHRDGIYFEFVTHSIVMENNSRKNIRYGLHFMFSNNDAYLENIFQENGAGVAVMYSHHVLMQRNQFLKNWGANAYGLLLKEISDASIVENLYQENTVGILMESTNRIEAHMNRFISNGWALRIQASCNENLVHHNNFLSNTFDVATNGMLVLNSFYNNYWDRYEGYDLDRNLVGDISFHPVSMYSMVIEQNPEAVVLLRSFMVSLLDKAEKAIPSLTPENLSDEAPLMKPLKL